MALKMAPSEASRTFKLDSQFDDCLYGMSLMEDVRISSLYDQKSYYCPCVGYGVGPPSVHEICIPADYYFSQQNKASFRSEPKGRERGRGRSRPMTVNESELSSEVGTVRNALVSSSPLSCNAEHVNHSVSSRIIDWLSNASAVEPGPGQSQETFSETLDEEWTDTHNDASAWCSSIEHAVSEAEQDVVIPKTRAMKAEEMKSYVKFRDNFLKESPPHAADKTQTNLSSMLGLSNGPDSQACQDKTCETARGLPQKFKSSRKNGKQNRRLNSGRMNHSSASPIKEDWKLKCNIHAAHQSGFAQEEDDDLIPSFQKMLQSEKESWNEPSSLGIGLTLHPKSAKEPQKTYDDHFPSLSSLSVETTSNSSSRKGPLSLKSIASILK